MHDAYIGRRSENNINCVVHDDHGRKNQTTLAAGKVTVGLVSHWPHVADINGSPPTAQGLEEGDEHSPLCSVMEHG